MEGKLYVVGILIGISTGIMIAQLFQHVYADSPKNQIKLAIDVCESELPRNQHCVIKGVPK